VASTGKTEALAGAASEPTAKAAATIRMPLLPGDEATVFLSVDGCFSHYLSAKVSRISAANRGSKFSQLAGIALSLTDPGCALSRLMLYTAPKRPVDGSLR
jgi:hypothetical protein